MRIGELAAVAGLSTRAIRHYHRRGVLPEPARRPNGYREYGLRDAILLARVRRLTELGLGLDEVRDALADTVATPADRDRVAAMLRNPSERGPEFHRRLESLMDAPIDGPRVADLAADIPPDLLATFTADVDDPFSVALLDTLAPAQAEVIRQVIRLIDEKP